MLYRIAQALALILPLKVAYRIADILGSGYYLLARNDRKVAGNNLRVVLNRHHSRSKIRHLSRMVFVNFARYLVEFLRTPRLSLRYLQSRITLKGRENLDAALGLGRGALLVSAHLGNWELGAMFLSLLGYKVNIVAWTHKNRSINDFFLRQRKSKGLKIIPLGSTIRHVFTALRHNETVALIGDIDFAKPQVGVKVKFFGQDTILPKGPAQFSLKLHCPIVSAFLVRDKDNRFRMTLEEPILYEASGNPGRDLVNLTQQIAQRLEAHIARHPAQWFMLTPRW